VCVRTDFAVSGGSTLECQTLSKDLPLYQPFVRDGLACLWRNARIRGQQRCVLRTGGKTA